MTSETARRWAARPVQARLLRVCVFMVPVAGSVVSVHIFSRLVEMPTSSFLLFALWWVAMSAAATGVLVALDRAARRLLPLVALLNLARVPRCGTVPLPRSDALEHRRDARAARRHAKALNDGSTPVEEAERLLALVAELNVHDRVTRGHSDRVRAYAQLIGKELHLSSNELDALNWAALLHDVGKLKVPAEILNKPGRPTEDEWTVLRRHTVYGEELIAPLRTGSGSGRTASVSITSAGTARATPTASGGDRISLRRTDRCRRGRLRRDHLGSFVQVAVASTVARDEIARCAGTHFDPRVVRAFLNISLGRLRLVMGPLSWLAHAPVLGRLPLTPAIGTVAASMATVAAALTTGLVATPPTPGLRARIVSGARRRRPIERVTREDGASSSTSTSPGAARASARCASSAQPAVGHVRVTPVAGSSTLRRPTSTATSRSVTGRACRVEVAASASC